MNKTGVTILTNVSLKNSCVQLLSTYIFVTGTWLSVSFFYTFLRVSITGKDSWHTTAPSRQDVDQHENQLQAYLSHCLHASDGYKQNIGSRLLLPLAPIMLCSKYFGLPLDPYNAPVLFPSLSLAQTGSWIKLLVRLVQPDLVRLDLFNHHDTDRCFVSVSWDTYAQIFNLASLHENKINLCFSFFICKPKKVFKNCL